MVGDLLAQWLAVEQTGTISRLRSTHDWLALTEGIGVTSLDSGRWIRDMSALGSIEVDWQRDRWSATPLVLTRIPEGDGLALVIGCRTNALDAALDASDLDVVRLPQTAPKTGLPRPNVAYVLYDSPELLPVAAKELGVGYLPCASLQLARVLQPPGRGTPAAPPNMRNATLERFNPVGLTWDKAEVHTLPQGAYRYEHFGQKNHLYKDADGWWQCDLPAAVYRALEGAGESVLQWRPDTNGRDSGQLFVDWGAPLPVLHQRCLVICSGRSPRFSDQAKTGIYDNVPRSIAEAVASTLGQTLDIL